MTYFDIGNIGTNNVYANNSFVGSSMSGFVDPTLSQPLFQQSPMDFQMMDSFIQTSLQQQAQMQAQFFKILTAILNNPNINSIPTQDIQNNFRPYDYNKFGENGDKIQKLTPEMQQKTMQLLDWAKANGLNVTIVSGYRTKEQQDALIEKTPHLAAKNSPHCRGKAIDVKIEGEKDADYKKLADYAKSIGMRWGGDFKNFTKERWHFDYNWR